MKATSRYRFCEVLQENGAVFLGPTLVFGFVDLADTIRHRVVEGETLRGIAARYYRPKARPEQFWWAIADFQPEPIRDPFLPLDGERALLVPSLRTLEERILVQARVNE